MKKAIGIDTYRRIIGISRDQKSSGLRDIDTLSGGVCGASVRCETLCSKSEVILMGNHCIIAKHNNSRAILYDSMRDKKKYLLKDICEMKKLTDIGGKM